MSKQTRAFVEPAPEPTPSAFATLAPDAESHFRLFYYTAVLCVIGHLHRLARAGGADLLRLYEFLKGYEDELRASAGGEAGGGGGGRRAARRRGGGGGGGGWGGGGGGGGGGGAPPRRRPPPLRNVPPPTTAS